MTAPWAKLDQTEVDIERIRALKTLARRARKLFQYVSIPAGYRYPVFHLRFPEPRATLIMLEEGNPPADSQRNVWERGLHLELDLNVGMPQSIRARVASLKANEERLNITAADAAVETVGNDGVGEGLTGLVRRDLEAEAARGPAHRPRSNLLTNPRDLQSAVASLRNRRRRARARVS